MLNPHESKTTLCPLAGTKTDMSPILTTNIILTKKPHYLDLVIILLKEELYTRLSTRRPNKIEANKPSLKVGLVQIKWKSILRNKNFLKNIPIPFVGIDI
jgi:hypothetical protein